MKKASLIVLTGGHAATTALATIQQLQKNPKTKTYPLAWIGAKSATEEKMFSLIKGIALHTITVGKLHRTFSFKTIFSLLKVPVGLWQSYWLLKKLCPSVVVSFGGNVGLTVCIAAWLHGIAIIVHEQTVAAGLANRISARLAQQVALARATSTVHFPKEKIVMTGNPIVQEVLDLPIKTKMSSPPVVLITGGSRGAHTINNTVEEALPKLLEKYRVIHLTGERELDRFNQKEISGYEVHGAVSPREMADLYKCSDIVVARAGANTVSEILVLRRPAIFIPIPWVQQNEQMKNAIVARDAGLAIIIKQSKLTPNGLIQKLDTLSKQWLKRVKNAHIPDEIPDDRNAASALVALIQDYI